jgi:hypothetical protein
MVILYVEVCKWALPPHKLAVNEIADAGRKILKKLNL